MDTKETSWLWSGKMIDCNGRVSRFNINKPNANGYSEFLIELLERDGHASEIKGEVGLKYDEQKNLVLNFENQNKNDQEKFSWTAKLKPSSPGIYAKECVFGTYETPNKDAFLSNGVMIMWQFQ